MELLKSYGTASQWLIAVRPQNLRSLCQELFSKNTSTDPLAPAILERIMFGAFSDAEGRRAAQRLGVKGSKNRVELISEIRTYLLTHIRKVRRVRCEQRIATLRARI